MSLVKIDDVFNLKENKNNKIFQNLQEKNIYNFDLKEEDNLYKEKKK